MQRDRKVVNVEDTNNFPTIAFSVIQAQRFRPVSRFAIYNWGSLLGERTYFVESKNVSLMDWCWRFLSWPFPGSYPRAFARISRMCAGYRVKIRPLRTHARIFADNNLRLDRGGKEWLLAQKPYCFLRGLVLVSLGILVVVDGRNCLEADDVTAQGIMYRGIGH